MGIRHPPLSGNAAEWPDFMKEEVERARIDLDKSCHSLLDWERIVKPLYDKWILYYMKKHTSNILANMQDLMSKFEGKCIKGAPELYLQLYDFLKDLSSDVAKNRSNVSLLTTPRG